MMKRMFFVLSATMLIVSCSQKKTPGEDSPSPEQLLFRMTLEEKVHLLAGTGMEGFNGDSAVVGEVLSIVSGATGATYPISRLGIPSIVLADGLAGTAFPAATALAATWNTELVENIGEAMGNEALEYGADVLLTPALKIQRDPLCGRNFEYYSEDPLLSGKMAAAMVRGIQSNGVGASLKYFAASNQETNRMGNDSRISPRALREIYLKGFEIAVKESQPWTIISSYNKINGVYTSESRGLLTTILRDEWGFNGTVMTNWFGGKDASAQVRAGNDLLMPGYPKQYDDIMAAVKDGKLTEKNINRNVLNILRLIRKTPRSKGYNYSDKAGLQTHGQVARQSAAEGMVLLKNDDSALPLPASAKKVAVYGISSYHFISGGTGRGDVNEAHTVSLVDGLKNAGYELDAGLQALYEKYIAGEKEKNKPDPLDPDTKFLPAIRPDEFVPNASNLSAQARAADVALITIGRTSGEFTDRGIDGDFNLTAREQELIKAVCKSFQSGGKKVVVILNTGGVIETASWKIRPDAVLLAWQTGQEGGNAVADVLTGNVNPSGKLPMTFPVNYMDVASSANFPYNPALAKSVGLTGRTQEGETEPVRNVDYTIYAEDIFVGYRYFDTFRQKVSYPFGYGLSYTTFAYDNPEIKEEKDSFVIAIEIVNTGEKAGKEIVQLYMSSPLDSDLPKPMKELKAFAKTGLLQPGESQVVEMKIDKTDLASFSDIEGLWVADRGNYKFLIGSSSQDIRNMLDVRISESIVKNVNNALLPREPINVLVP